MTSSEGPSSGTISEKRGVPSRTEGETILEMLWKPQMPWIIGLGASQPYSRAEFQETLWERFRGLSGIFPEFLPESPSRTGGMAQKHCQQNQLQKQQPQSKQNNTKTKTPNKEEHVPSMSVLWAPDRNTKLKGMELVRCGGSPDHLTSQRKNN